MQDLDPRGAAHLAEVIRGNTLESVHRGHLVVTRPDGAVRFALGNPDAMILPRSSLKPLQAVALVRAGLNLAPEHLAVACASHNGEPEHLATVRALLAGIGLSEEDLDNTPGLPLFPKAATEWLAGGGQPAHITQNCSGKHAAMLAAAVHLGAATAGYRDPAHPVQQLITAEIARRSTGQVPAPEVDGCGAPAFAMSVADLARSFGQIAAAPLGPDAAAAPGSSGLHAPEAAVAHAMSTHPFLVGGTGRFVTDLMTAVPDTVAKDGAEGVLAVGLADGTGLAVKILDGELRGAIAAICTALIHLGVDRVTVERVGFQPVKGAGQVVGQVRAGFEIKE